MTDATMDSLLEMHQRIIGLEKIVHGMIESNKKLVDIIKRHDIALNNLYVDAKKKKGRVLLV